MFTLNFGIKNPFSERFECIVNKHGRLTENKSWDFQFSKTNYLVGIEITFTTKQCHSGLYLSLTLFGYEVVYSIHDNRHWDYLTGQWEINEENK